MSWLKLNRPSMNTLICALDTTHNRHSTQLTTMYHVTAHTVAVQSQTLNSSTMADLGSRAGHTLTGYWWFVPTSLLHSGIHDVLLIDFTTSAPNYINSSVFTTVFQLTDCCACTVWLGGRVVRTWLAISRLRVRLLASPLSSATLGKLTHMCLCHQAV